jgi:hypothetical protein
VWVPELSADEKIHLGEEMSDVLLYLTRMAGKLRLCVRQDLVCCAHVTEWLVGVFSYAQTGVTSIYRPPFYVRLK